VRGALFRHNKGTPVLGTTGTRPAVVLWEAEDASVDLHWAQECVRPILEAAARTPDGALLLSPERIAEICASLGRIVPISAQNRNANHFDDVVLKQHKKKRKGAFDVGIPIQLSRGCTVHRVQGQSLSKMLLSLGKTERVGVTHTAFSRGTTADSIALLPPFDRTRLVKQINAGGKYGGTNGMTAGQIVSMLLRMTHRTKEKLHQGTLYPRPSFVLAN